MKFKILVLLFILTATVLTFSCDKTDRNTKLQTTFPKETTDHQAWIKYARNTSHNTFIGGSLDRIVNKGRLNKKPLFGNYALQRGGMIIVDDRIYVANDKGRLVAVEIETGDVVWLSQPALASNRQFAHPTYYRGFLYCGTQPGGLVCLDAETGRFVWEQKNDSVLKGIRTCPSVNDDSVFFVDVESRGFLLDSLSGREIWQFDSNRTETAMSDPLAIGDTYIIGLPSGLVQALTADSDIIWTTMFTNGIECTPMLEGNTIYFTGLDGIFYEADAKTGSVSLATQLSGRSDSTPLIHNGNAIVCDDDNFVYCLSTNTGEILWKLEVEGVPMSLCIGFDNSIVIFSSSNAVFHKLDLAIPANQDDIDAFLRKKAPFEVITVEDARAFKQTSDGRRKDSDQPKPRPIEIEELKSIFPNGIEALFSRHARMYVLSWDGMIKSESALPIPLQNSPVFYKGKIYTLDSEGYINVFECNGV